MPSRTHLASDNFFASNSGRSRLRDIAVRSMDIFPQILISGASGLVGGALQAHFAAQGVACSTLVRHTAQPGSSAYFWDPYNFEFRPGMRRLSGIRAAIHLSGDNLTNGRWTAAKKQAIRQSRVRTTRSLVELLSHLDHRPEVLLCASAVGFFGDRGDEILTEESSSGKGFLPQVSREWEAAAQRRNRPGNPRRPSPLRRHSCAPGRSLGQVASRLSHGIGRQPRQRAPVDELDFASDCP